MRISVRFLSIIAVLLSASGTLALAQATLRSGTFGGGITAGSSDGRGVMVGTVGQAVIGPVTNGVNAAGQGFWYTLPLQSLSGVRFNPVVAGSDVVLHQNVPNPFSSTTEIAFDIPKGGAVSLKLYDGMGREVATLVDGVREAGRVTTTVSASDLQSGYYTARLVAGGVTKTVTMVVVR